MSKENDKLIKQFQDYLNYERNYSKNTVNSYLNDLNEAKEFFKENGGFSGWDQVKSRDVEIFLQDLATQNRSRTTQARKMSSLRSFYRFLVKREVLDNDPMQTISLRLGEKKLPQFFYEKRCDKSLIVLPVMTSWWFEIARCLNFFTRLGCV